MVGDSLPCRASRLALIFVVVFSVAAIASGEAVADTAAKTRRVIAIGDIHGAYNGVRSILREVALVDDNDRWVGGDAVLVQTGDFLDRGPGATKVARLLLDLRRQAPEQGGEVVVLLGHHEILNIVGDLRDVTKYIVRNHVDSNSEKRLKVSCNTYASFYRQRAQQQGLKPPRRGELIDKCQAEQHLGLVEYLSEIGPEGEIGRWMRGLPAVVHVDGVVFLHGGISPQLKELDLEQINRETRREIDSFDRAREYLVDKGLILPTSGLPEIVGMARAVAEASTNGGGFVLTPSLRHLLEITEWLLIREDGPFWFRGYTSWSEEEGTAEMPAILDALEAERLVVAHTPQVSYSITGRFDSQVFLIDTGMLNSVYGGRPSALEIQDGRFTAVYTMQRTVLHEPQALAAAD